MKLLLFLSEITIPLLIFCIVGYGLLNRQPVYEEFVEGAKDGFWTVIKIMPTLIGLMVAVGVLRASGLLDCIAQGLGQVTAEIGFPAELFPVTIVKCFLPRRRPGCCSIFTKSTVQIPRLEKWHLL